MSRSNRIALVVAAVAVAVVAFVVVQPGGDDEPEGSAATTPAQPDTRTDTGDDSAEPQPTTETETPSTSQPEITRIDIRRGAVRGGAKTIEAVKGDTVRILVTADAPDEIHLHGYDITRDAGPGQPARFLFKADAEGAFEMESHVAADAGLDAVVARVIVAPS